MLAYAWKVVTGRRSIWAPSLVCGVLIAIPGSLVATVFAAPTAGLLVSGDLDVMRGLLPGRLAHLGPPGMSGVLVAGAVLLCVWSRIYAVGLWLSDDRKDPALGAAVGATRRSWRGVTLRYLEAGVAVGFVIGVVVALTALAGGTAGAGGLVTSVGLILVWRTFVRAFLTLALRAVVLDEARGWAAWRRASEIVRARRADVFAAWVALLAAGVAVWMIGRLISPVLQDTAYDYPNLAVYSILHEIAQVLLAGPLEGFLLALSLGVWTAVYRGGELVERAAPRPEAGRSRSTDPWLVRGLAALVVLAIVANGIPTLIDSAYRRSRDEAVASIQRRQIEPDEVVVRAQRAKTGTRTRYSVSARLDGEALKWRTRIDYLNDTGEPLRDIGIHVYPAAYARPLEEVPLARDLLAGDLSGALRRDAAPGTLEVRKVSVAGATSEVRLRDTFLVVPLNRELAPGGRTTVELKLAATLPRFPERFGAWREMTLLGNWIPVVAMRSGEGWRSDDFGTVGDPFFSAIADYRVTIRTDDGIGIVGTGALTSVRHEEGTRLWRFEAAGVRDAAYAASPFMRGLQTQMDGVTVRSWFLADDSLRGAENLSTARSAVGYYAQHYGELPYDEVEVVETKGMAGGMEYPGVVFASSIDSALEGVPLLPNILRHAGFADAQGRYVVGHEIAHQWWYSVVGNDEVRRPWLDEAFAEVSTRLWLRATEGDDRTWLTTSLGTEAPPGPGVLSAEVTDFEDNTAYTAVVYGAGADVLLEVRALIGAERFDRLLRDWYQESAQEIATVGSFIEMVRSSVSPEAARLLERYR